MVTYCYDNYCVSCFIPSIVKRGCAGGWETVILMLVVGFILTIGVVIFQERLRRKHESKLDNKKRNKKDY